METTNLHLAEDKLSILFFVDSLGISLSNIQITQFFLEKNIINYFDLQQFLAELVSSDLLTYTKTRNSHFYNITSKGKETLRYFEKRILSSIRNDILEYAINNRERLKKESQIISEYKKLNENEYEVICKVMEEEISLIEIKISVTNSTQAKLISNSWKINAPKIYKNIMSDLIN